MSFLRTLVLALILILFVNCGERYYTSGDQLNQPVDSLTQIFSERSKSINTVKEIHGKVVHISDGDTFAMIINNDFEVRIRLNGIDCPEKKQAFSTRSKEVLSDLIFGKTVLVKYKSKDGRGRVLGDVFINGINVNQEIVRCGFAWHYKKYSDDAILDRLEREARMKKIGLWLDPNPIPPWEYRKQ